MTSRPPRAMRWSQERRLEFIDSRLCWDGQLNRADLCSSFGISVPQASVDIARYTALAAHNLRYDKATRSYVATAKFRPAFAATDSDVFLRGLLNAATSAEQVPVATMPTPIRSLDIAVVRPLWSAIRESSGLRILYQSLSKPKLAERIVSPHALAHDGFRWHMRAYCHAREAFRDFVIARVLQVKGPAPVGLGATDDHDWNTFVTLILSPHPKLSPAHRRAIELDYGMRKGQVGLRCRKALLFYTLHHLRLDERSNSSPEAQQIVLKNAAEILGVGSATPAHGAEKNAASRRALGSRTTARLQT